MPAVLTGRVVVGEGVVVVVEALHRAFFSTESKFSNSWQNSSFAWYSTINNTDPPKAGGKLGQEQLIKEHSELFEDKRTPESSNDINNKQVKEVLQSK